MADHDLQLLKDARGPIKAFDQNGNYRKNWYENRIKCYDFYKDRHKEYRLFLYHDGSYQLAYLWDREIITSSW